MGTEGPRNFAKHRRSRSFKPLYTALVLTAIALEWRALTKIPSEQKLYLPASEIAATERMSILSPGATSLSAGAIWNQHSIMLLEGSAPLPDRLAEDISKLSSTFVVSRHRGPEADLLAAAYSVLRLPAVLYIPPNCAAGVSTCFPHVFNWPEKEPIRKPDVAAVTKWLLKVARLYITLIADIFGSTVDFVETLPDGGQGARVQVDPISQSWAATQLGAKWTALVNNSVVTTLTVSTDGAFPVRLPGSCSFWDDFRGCKLNLPETKESIERRAVYENDRVRLLVEQPSQLPNYTATGFEVAKTPPLLLEALQNYFQLTKANYSREADNERVTCLLVDLPSTGPFLDSINAIMQPILEKWSGVRLAPSAIYGIRIYRRGSALPDHVDRVGTHVVSAIINVGQKVDTPWPLDILDHKGARHMVTVVPGEMIMYEGASCAHGREEPLNGDWFANTFVHFSVPSLKFPSEVQK